MVAEKYRNQIATWSGGGYDGFKYNYHLAFEDRIETQGDDHE